mgnify:FL=1
MAQCDFLDWRWSDSYYCRKTDKAVDKNTVDTYCDNSLRYRDCPIYCGGSSSGGCYLTTACVNTKNLPDDCRELTVLRSFRDGYLVNQPDGEAEVQEYYRTAPKIVEIIDHQNNRDEIYEDLYSNVISPCVELIEQGNNAEAYDKYKKMVKDLEKKFM